MVVRAVPAVCINRVRGQERVGQEMVVGTGPAVCIKSMQCNAIRSNPRQVNKQGMCGAFLPIIHGCIQMRLPLPIIHCQAKPIQSFYQHIPHTLHTAPELLCFFFSSSSFSSSIFLFSSFSLSLPPFPFPFPSLFVFQC